MSKYYYKTIFIVALVFGLFVSPVFANNRPPTLEGIFPVIYNAVEFLFGFISIISAAMVVYGAYMWMSSGGDPQKTKMAQGVLTWAIVGLIFFMILFFFFDSILGFFGISVTAPDGTGLF